MSFEFMSASRIVFGENALQNTAPSFLLMGKQALVVTSQDGANPSRLTVFLDRLGLAYNVFPTRGEPTIQTLREGCEIAKNHGIDLVIAFGGGSVIDMGKAISGLVANGGDPLDYLEAVGRGLALTRPALPMVAIPTTSGTGSEVTKNAVLAVPEKKVKVSLRSPFLLPRLALVDPALTVTMPPSVTASTGMDALAQVIEPFVTRKANPLVDVYCKEGLARVGRSLLIAYQDGENLTARVNMSFASLLGGFSLANAGLGAVHGFAAPIGGMFNAPHGAVCARLLPEVVDINIRALKSREPGSAVIEKYLTAASILSGKDVNDPQDFVEWLRWMCDQLKIPRLKDFGIGAGDREEIVKQASVASSMQGNPIRLTHDEMVEILEKSL